MQDTKGYKEIRGIDSYKEIERGGGRYKNREKEGGMKIGRW